MVQSVLIAPHPKLRAKSQAVKGREPNLSNLVRDLIDILNKSLIPGAGLSAPQIGVSKRVFVVNLSLPEKVKRGKKSKQTKSTTNYQVFVNPKIIWTSKETNIDAIPEENLYLEGCLSVPNIYALIKRPYKIRLQWQTLNPKAPTSDFSVSPARLATRLDSARQAKRAGRQLLTSDFEGFSATLIQHEIDHLNGILFTDHALAQSATLYEDKKGELKKSDDWIIPTPPP